MRQAFDHGPWPRMTGRERGAILYKFADLMEQNTHELAILESLDNGKPLSASKYDQLSPCSSYLSASQVCLYKLIALLEFTKYGSLPLTAIGYPVQVQSTSSLTRHVILLLPKSFCSAVVIWIFICWAVLPAYMLCPVFLAIFCQHMLMHSDIVHQLLPPPPHQAASVQ